MTVERISAPENRRAVVLSTQHLSDTTCSTGRRWISSSPASRHPGAQKRSLSKQKYGQWGVYAVVGAQAEFSPSPWSEGTMTTI